MGEDRELENIAPLAGQPLENLEIEKLEPANPDDLPTVPTLPEQMFKITPERAAFFLEILNEVADKVKKAFQQIVEATTVAVQLAKEKASWIIESEMYFANNNPRWWHLYKHAKKARTRKKYRRLLMKQLHRSLRGAAKKKEAKI